MTRVAAGVQGMSGKDTFLATNVSNSEPLNTLARNASTEHPPASAALSSLTCGMRWCSAAWLSVGSTALLSGVV